MNTKHALSVTFDDVLAARDRISPHINHPPQLRLPALCDIFGIDVVLQCENLQQTGSFKFRGASNAMELLLPDQRSRGVITYSSGNHAQAIARAAQIRNTAATVVMPDNAPAVKVAGVRRAGATIVQYNPATEDRESICNQIARDTGKTVIPPYNHPHVIAGQGTAALELIENAGSFDAILAPCGGGGLLSGTAISTKSLLPHCKVYGVEPSQADDAARSFATRTLCSVHHPQTIADGARTPSLGEHTFPVVMELVDGFYTVTEPQIAHAMRMLIEMCKLVVEPTGAVSLAGLIAQRAHWQGKRVGIVVSGGNVDLAKLPEYFALADQYRET